MDRTVVPVPHSSEEVARVITHLSFDARLVSLANQFLNCYLQAVNALRPHELVAVMPTHVTVEEDKIVGGIAAITYQFSDFDGRPQDPVQVAVVDLATGQLTGWGLPPTLPVDRQRTWTQVSHDLDRFLRPVFLLVFGGPKPPLG